MINEKKALERARRNVDFEMVSGSSNIQSALIRLFHESYPQDGVLGNPAYLHWEYDLNPAGEVIASTGMKTAEAIGHYAVIPLRYQIQSSEMLGSLSVNTATHPAYRGRGAFMILAEDVFKQCRDRHVALTLGFPNPNSHKGFIKHLDFKEIGQLPLWIRPLRMDRLVQARADREGFLVKSMLRMASGCWPMVSGVLDLIAGKPDLPITRIKTIDSSFDRLWKRVQTQYKNILVRDQRYLEWRFLQNPARQYQIFVCTQGPEDISGYLIAHEVQIEGIRCGMIVDLLTEKSSYGRKVAKNLIQAVMRYYKENDVELAGCLMPWKTPAISGLWRMGFVPCPARWLPQKFPVVLRWHASTVPPADLYDMSHWYLTMGDYDVV
jgi:GNAT superfamily N-acetyltransferase